MVFIISNRKLHLSDNFWKFKTQNIEYNYIIFVYIKNSNRLWKYIKTKQKTTPF